MKKTSCIPELMNSNEVVIVDENEIPVKICEKSNCLFNYNLFQPPSIIIDNYEKRRYKDIEIKNIDLDYLNKLGYRLVSVSLKGTSGSKRNFPNQMKAHLLESPITPIPNSRILTSIPPDHFIQLDIINNRIRIYGRSALPYNRAENASPWIQLIKK